MDANIGSSPVRLTRMGPVPKPISERFWAKVDRRGPDDCWLWLGAHDQHGYGQLRVGSTVDGSRRAMRAPRLAYELAIGPVEPQRHVLHHCDTPNCCNPIHLFTGSHADNMADMRRKARASSPKGEAKRNAVLTDAVVRGIREMYGRGGVSQRGIAHLLGLNENTVKGVLSGRRWSHVT